MKDEYMFLTFISLGPSNREDKLDVFLQLIIAKLIELWSIGAKTYDVQLKTSFTMCVSLLFRISDFLHMQCYLDEVPGKLACSYFIEDSEAFTFPNGGKTS